MTENWKPVKGYEEFYSVSDRGRVFSIRTNRMLRPDTTRAGYKRVFFFGKSGKKRMSVHRVVALHFLGDPKNGNNVINHLDSDPGNNQVENLEWTTTSGNAIHARDANRLMVPTGEKNGMAKLTDELVKVILSMWNSGVSQKAIGNNLGFPRSTISGITQGHKWKHMQHLNIRGKVWTS